MEIHCLVCGSPLVELKEPCDGQATHCSVTVRWSSDGTFWEHSREGYNPMHIWTSKIPLVEKERDLRRLSRRLHVMERDAHQVLTVNRISATKFADRAATALLNSVVADAHAKPKSTYEGLTVKWEEKGKVNKLWIEMMRMWAKANTKLTACELEDTFTDILTTVRFARQHGLDVPPNLEGIR